MLRRAAGSLCGAQPAGTVMLACFGRAGCWLSKYGFLGAWRPAFGGTYGRCRRLVHCVFGDELAWTGHVCTPDAFEGWDLLGSGYGEHLLV